VNTSLLEFWNQVLARLQLQLSRPTFETWIQNTKAEDFNNNCLTIRTPNRFVYNHLQKHYLKIIADVVQEILGEAIELQLLADREDNIDVFEETDRFSSNSYISNRENLLTDTEPNHPRPNKLNPKYTFYRFVVGTTNRMAHAASLAVAESPGRDFNPLFIYGGVGLGKTHLMQAIGHYHLEIFPNAKVFYVSTEKFTNDLISAIRNDNMQSFREHYRTADILLVDDIQFIEKGESTQEEFFHTFNTLYEAGKQVVLASDRPPDRIPRLQDRLCSRFSMGLIADIQVPDLETRMAILQKKAEYENMRLPREIIEYIASNYTSNIRELEGGLIRAIAYISISGLPMTVENIAPVLNPPIERAIASPETVIEIVSEVFKISVEDLKSNSRRREISWARQIGMYLMRQYTDLSLPRIGEEFGGKDHTTVMYSCEKIEQLKKKDADLSQTLSQLSDRINLVSKG
jgi:chromosomal replication initiator protein